jgi:hypothetical protein
VRGERPYGEAARRRSRSALDAFLLGWHGDTLDLSAESARLSPPGRETEAT